MKVRVAFFLAIIVCNFLAAQTSCPTPEDLDSKALKLFEKADSPKKKTTILERVGHLREAIDHQDDYGQAYELLASLLFKQSKRNSELISECRASTSKWMEICEAHGSEAYYMLGALAYMESNTHEALEYFESFLEKSVDDESSKINRRRNEVLNLIPELKFEIDFYANEGTYSPTPLPMTSLINDEYLPALSPDGSILFFTRASNSKARGDVVTKRIEELVWAKRNSSDTPFDVGEVLDYPFNDGENYGGVSLSIDNKVLIIAATNPNVRNEHNIDLFQTTYKVDGKDDEGNFFYYWDDLELLGPQINTVMGWESQPALSSDAMELFFASARATSTPDKDGNPTMDIYVSRKDSTGAWGVAEILPGPISTEAQEKAPFLHPDGKTLYFSSNRTPSGGGYDLWVTRRDENGNWSEPTNMGTPVNTNGDEHGLVVSSTGDEAFFASRRLGTMGLDILRFPVPEALRPEAVKVIHGAVDPTPPEENLRLTINYVQSKQVEEIKLNKDDGTFAAIIRTELNEDVIPQVKGKNVAFEAMVVHQAGEVPTGNPTPEIKLRAHKASDESAFELRDVQFAPNSTKMSDAAKLVLDAFASYLNEHRKYQVDIEGHTDNIGRPNENLDLSKRRAEVVAVYLTNKGVSSKRLHSRGFGQEKPKASNQTTEGRALNRRTEFTVWD